METPAQQDLLSMLSEISPRLEKLPEAGTGLERTFGSFSFDLDALHSHNLLSIQNSGPISEDRVSHGLSMEAPSPLGTGPFHGLRPGLAIPSPRSPAEQILSQMPEQPLRQRGHRRTQSAVHFRDVPSTLDENVDYNLHQEGEGEIEPLSHGLDLAQYLNLYGASDAELSKGELEGGLLNPGFHGRSFSADDDALSGPRFPLNSASQNSSASGERRGIRRSFDCGNSTELDDIDESAQRAMAARNFQELKLTDPKRAKRILANRQSAARSKERKTRYICELEEKLAHYEKQTVTLKATLTILQRETTSLVDVNDKLNKKVHIMEGMYRQVDGENKRHMRELEHLRNQAPVLPRTPDNLEVLLLQLQQQQHQQQQREQQQHQLLALQRLFQERQGQSGQQTFENFASASDLFPSNTQDTYMFKTEHE